MTREEHRERAERFLSDSARPWHGCERCGEISHTSVKKLAAEFAEVEERARAEAFEAAAEEAERAPSKLTGIGWNAAYADEIAARLRALAPPESPTTEGV